jgi:hypothetical protein
MESSQFSACFVWLRSASGAENQATTSALGAANQLGAALDSSLFTISAGRTHTGAQYPVGGRK